MYMYNEVYKKHMYLFQNQSALLNRKAQKSHSRAQTHGWDKNKCLFNIQNCSFHYKF